MTKHVLEPAAQAFAEATSQPPFLYELGPEGARMLVLAMDESAAHRFFRLLATTDDPALTVVGRG